MARDLLDVYRDASLARWRATSLAEREEIEEPGLYGLLEAPEHPGVVMLVTDDRSYPQLARILADTRAGMMQVFTTATRSLQLLARDQAWARSTSTAMVNQELHETPRVPLSGAFRIRPVRRVREDPSDAVSLDDAVACIARAAPYENAERLTRFVTSLAAMRLFAAVDEREAVRATAGYQLIGDHAWVLLIDTDPAFQRRGLATAMTSAVLVDAQRRGAREASLDASDSGGSVYRRLGFQPVGPAARFIR